MVKKAAKKKVAKKVAKKVESGFVFIGGGYGDAKSVSLYGYTFDLNGKAVEVNDDVAAKLRNRGYFKEV